MPEPSERRSGLRIHLRAESVRVVLRAGVESVTASVNDLSLEGALLALDRALGDRIRIGQRAELLLDDEVVSVMIRHIEMTRPWEPTCGVEFTDDSTRVAAFVMAVSVARGRARG